jgi:hypothetical protein
MPKLIGRGGAAFTNKKHAIKTMHKKQQNKELITRLF